MRGCVAVTCILVGCRFSPQAAPSDSPGMGSGSADAAIDAPQQDGSAAPRDCMPDWRAGTIAFGTPQIISELSTPAIERDPFLTQDELTIYFWRKGSADADVYAASRAQLGDAFGAAMPFTIVNTSQDESKLSISRDGLTLILDRAEPAGGADDYMVTRASTSEPWTAPTLDNLDNVNVNYAPFDPELGSDGDTLFFAPEPDDGDPQQLAAAKRGTTSSEFQITSIPGYSPDDSYSDSDPWLDLAGDVLVFSRFDVDNVDVDIMYMTAGSNGRFGSAAPVPGVSTVGHNDGDPWVSPDGCRMYFSSNRAGYYDLYVATAQ